MTDAFDAIDARRDALTAAEKKAITSLERLAKTWPRSLRLFSWSGSLVVVPTNFEMNDGTSLNDALVAYIDGIPNDGGDPD